MLTRKIIHVTPTSALKVSAAFGTSVIGWLLAHPSWSRDASRQPSRRRRRVIHIASTPHSTCATVLQSLLRKKKSFASSSPSLLLGHHFTMSSIGLRRLASTPSVRCIPICRHHHQSTIADRTLQLSKALRNQSRAFSATRSAGTCWGIGNLALRGLPGD